MPGYSDTRNRSSAEPAGGRRVRLLGWGNNVVVSDGRSKGTGYGKPSRLIQDPYDKATVHAYGQSQAAYGGMYWEGDTLVAMFTDELDAHRERLLPRLRVPERFRVASASRTFLQIKEANGRVRTKLLGDPTMPFPEICGVGIGMEDGQFVIKIWVEHLSEALVEEIREAAEPDEVVVAKGFRALRA